MTGEETERVRLLLKGLRAVAKEAWPARSYWDVVVDGERLLRGEPALMWDHDVSGWCVHVEVLLAASAARREP